MADGFSKTRKAETHKIHLDQLAELYEPRLDWRNPNYDIAFETPTSDWIEKLDFFVKIHAEGPVNRNAPIFIRFNDDDPVPVYSRGNSFEAMINLDTSSVRAHRNMISVSFGKAEGCIEETDGAFSIDMRESFLVVRTSAPSRTYYLRDAKQILNSPLTTPKTVGLKAYGESKLKYQALAAQGMALNMPSLPRYSVNGGGEAQVYIGTRRELKSIIAGTELARREGPIIGVTQNAPLRLVLTADNHEELGKLVEEFASKEIPAARRTFAYGGEYAWQTPFMVANSPIQGKTPIYELGSLRFDRGWGNSAQSVKFDVDNPLSAKGTTKLYFHKSPGVSSSSIVNVQLNGKNLGSVSLKHKRTAGQFDIPGGLLVGTDNILTINPELTPKEKFENCAENSVGAGFAVNAKSYIDVKSTSAAFTGDLTRLAASGFPFSSDAGEQSAVVFATSKNSDQAAALRAFAQLGKSYGTGWINAEFFKLSEAPSTRDKHALFIGPRLNMQTPRGLSAEIDGRSNIPKRVNTAEMTALPSISLLSARRTVKGGVVAIYEGNHLGYLNGYLTSSRGYSFPRAIDQIVRRDHWNKLQGSMARWNGSKVEMAKTAFKSEPVAKRENSDEQTSALIDLSEFSLPKVPLPTVTFPEISLPSVKPAVQRLQRGTNKTRDMFSSSWIGFKTKTASIFERAPTPEPKPVARPTPAISAEVSIPKPKSTPKPMTPVTGTIVATPAPRPTITTAPAPNANATTERIRAVSVPNQYNPGATLRGLSKVNATPKVTSQYLPIAERVKQSSEAAQTAKSGIQNRFKSVSGWVGQKLDALSGSGANAKDGRQANLILFAIATILLLLLLALAKPESYRD